MKKILTIAISLMLVFVMTITSSAATIASLNAAVGTDADRTVQVTVNYNSPEEAQESTLLVVKKGVSIVTATADEIHYIDQKTVDGNSVTYSIKLAEGDRIGQYDLYVGGTKVDAPASTEINFDMDATTTIKFVNEDGEEIASQIMVSSQIGDTITVGNYAPQTITYGTSIYSKDASNPSTFIASSSTNTLTVTYTYLMEKREQITVGGTSYDLVTDNLVFNGDMSQTTNDGTYTYVTGWQGGYVNKVHNPLSNRPYLYEGGGWRSTTDHHFIYTAATDSSLAYVTTPAVTTMTNSEAYPFKSDASENYMASVLTSWMMDSRDSSAYLKAESGKQYYMSFDIMATSINGNSWVNNVLGFTAVTENGDTYANKIPGTNGDINTLTWVLDSSIGRGKHTTVANQWTTLSTVATANSDGYFMFQLGWAHEWGQTSVRNFKIYEIEPSATNKDITVTYTVNDTTVDSKTQTINTSAVTKANFDEYYYRANGTNTLYYAAAQSVSDNTTVAMTALPNWGNYEIDDTVSTDTAVYKIVSGNLAPNGNFEYGMNGWYSRANSTPPTTYSVTTTDKPADAQSAALSTGAGGNTSANSIKQAWDIEVGDTYYYSMWVKAGDQWHGLGQAAEPTVEALDLIGNGGFGTGGTWVQKTGVFTATQEYLVFFEGWGSVGLADVEVYKVELDASQSATTTIKFVDGNGNEIATSVTVDGIIGSVIDLTDTTLIPEAITYNGNVYSKKSTNATSYTVAGQTDTVTITYETDAITSIDVTSVAVIDGNLPILPTTLNAATGAGAATTVTVTSWDTSSLKVGANTVYGTVDGLTIKAQANVTVLAKTFDLNDATSTTAGSGNVLKFPVDLSDEFYMEFDFVSTNVANNWLYISQDGALWGAGQIGIGTNNDQTGSLKAQPVDEVIGTITAGTTYRMFIRGDASTDTYDLTVYDTNAKTTLASVAGRSFRAVGDTINSINLCTNGGGEYTLSNIKVHSATASVETYTVNAVAAGSTLESFTAYTGSTDKLGYDDNAIYPYVKIPSYDGYVFKNKTVSGSVVTLNYEAVAEAAFFDNVADDTTFVSLNMLGAHDAFTASISSSDAKFDAAGTAQGDSGSKSAVSSASTAAPMSKAQSSDALTMLNHGVRYFDIRLSRSDTTAKGGLLGLTTVNHTNGVFYTTHGMLSDEFRPIAYTIAQWAKEHPGEIIVLDFQEMWDNTSTAGSSGDSVAQSWIDLNNLLTEAGIYDYVTINNSTDLSTVTYGSLTNNGTKAGIVLFGRAVATNASVGSFILRGTTSAAFDGKMYSNYDKGDASVSSSSLAADYIQAQVDHAYTQTGTVNNMYRVMQAISSTSNLINQAGTDNTYIAGAVKTNPTWLTTLPVIMVNDATVNTSDLLATLKACNVPVDVTMNYSVGGTVTDSGKAKLMVGTLYTNVVGALYAGASGEYAVTEAVTGEVPVPYNGSVTITVEKLGNVYSTRIENNAHSVYSGNLDDAAVYAGKTNFAAYTWGQDNDRLGVAVLTAEQGRDNYALSVNVVRKNFNQDYRNVKFYALPVIEYRALDLSNKDALLAKLTDDTLVAAINPDNYDVGSRIIALDGAKIKAAAASGDVVIIGNAQGGLYGIEGSSMAIVPGYNVTVNGDMTVSYGTYTLPSDSSAIAFHKEDTKEVYKAAETVTITADTEFTPYYSTGVEMVVGAQVRIGDGVTEDGKASSSSGLRFITTVDRSDTLASLDSEIDMEMGVEITAEGSETSPVVIKAEQWQDGDAKSVFTTAITNLAVGNFNRKFTATPYIKVNDRTFYGTPITRSIYQVAAGLLTSDMENTDETDYDDTALAAKRMIEVLNAYVNQTGIRLTLATNDETQTVEFVARTDGTGAYSGEVFFEVGETIVNGTVYSVTLTPVGENTKINMDYWNEYIRINNNNSSVKAKTTLTENSNGTYTLTFDTADL
ncbi:MAG: hypothetical protein IJ297_06905 [Clostridia bacterium]|nr:hypothetical protein [Clostridia bacterium]